MESIKDDEIMDTCTSCMGSGVGSTPDERCPTCKGSGSAYRQMTNEELKDFINQQFDFLRGDVGKRLSKPIIFEQHKDESVIEYIERRFVNADGMIEYTDQFKNYLTKKLMQFEPEQQRKLWHDYVWLCGKQGEENAEAKFLIKRK